MTTRMDQVDNLLEAREAEPELAFKVGEISALIVSGSGLMGMAMMAATAGKAGLAKAASGAGGGKMLKGK